MVDGTAARHVGGKWFLGRDRAGCVGMWSMDAGCGDNAKFSKILSRES